MEEMEMTCAMQPCEMPAPQVDLEDLIYGWERPVSDR